VQQAEKHHLALKANEAATAQRVEKYRLAIKEYEARQRAAEEARRNLENEKKPSLPSLRRRLRKKRDWVRVFNRPAKYWKN